MAGGGRVLLVRVRPGDLRPGRRRVPGDVGDHRDARPPGPAPAFSVLVSRARATRSRCPHWQRRAAPTTSPSASAREARMKLLVTGGAGFIGSTYVRHRLADPPERLGRVLDKLTYAGRRGEPRRALDESRVEFVEADIADRRGRRARDRGLRRDRQLRRRVARRPLDRGARATSSRPTSSAPSCCSRPPATPASATCRSRPTRSTARSRRARSPRPRRSTPPRPTRRRRPAATCSSAPTTTPTAPTR